MKSRRVSEVVREELLRQFAGGISQSQMARESGISQRAISAFLRGGGLSLENLDSLCEWMKVEVRISPDQKKL